MYICMCNPFTDKDVKKHFEESGKKTTMVETYSACSGGEKMNCGSCTSSLKSMVDHHNNEITIRTLEKALPQTEKETV